MSVPVWTSRTSFTEILTILRSLGANERVAGGEGGAYFRVLRWQFRRTSTFFKVI